jgi:hypothetical protein
MGHPAAAENTGNARLLTRAHDVKRPAQYQFPSNGPMFRRLTKRCFGDLMLGSLAAEVSPFISPTNVI